MVAALEAPDTYITLRRASQLSGVSSGTLRVQANKGKLHTVRLGHDLLTTRRWLHAYLMEASERDRGRRLPLPADYQAPE
jgi:hypothetical protein